VAAGRFGSRDDLDRSESNAGVFPARQVGNKWQSRSGLGTMPCTGDYPGGRMARRGGSEMKKLLLLAAAVALISTSAIAQSTVVTTTGTGHTAVQIEPEYRTRIRAYVTEHKVRPVATQEKIIVGGAVPREVELEAVPSDWGPSLTRYRYIYSGDRVMLVDPGTRTVVQEID
jgi:hypothetical protein